MTTLDDFLSLSRTVGDPTLDAAILGEGNTSAALEGGEFLVKASGCTLATMTAEHAVRLRAAPLLELLDAGPVDETRLQAVYAAAKSDPAQKARPSVEAVFHALLLSYPGVAFVAHTHPTAVNALTCSPRWREVLDGRLCPDEAVVLGRDSVLVPYVDPGVELARRIRAGVDRHRERHGEVPKVVYMQNHGVIALGASARECGNITAMAIKAARMRLMALQTGGLRPLPPAVVRHLLARPDEKYRQKVLTP